MSDEGYPQATMGRLLRRWRVEHSMTQQALADRLGMSSLTIHRWETDAQNPQGSARLLYYALRGLEQALEQEEQEALRQRARAAPHRDVR